MKNLTVNRLALGNLKHRRKQYAIMIIGIILAMVFSSSIVLFIFSAGETYRETQSKKYGKQTVAILSENITDEDYIDAVDKGFLLSYGYMHNIGYAYTDGDEKNLGCAVTWLDDNADKLYFLTMQEGRKPAVESEIAVEKTALRRLGYKNTAVGDKITVNLDIANGADFGNTVKKEYTVVGIYEDRKTNNEEKYYGTSTKDYDKYTPAIYVAQNTPVEPGGKELKLALIEANKSYGKYHCEKENGDYSKDFAYYGYFTDKGFFNDGEKAQYCTGVGHMSSMHTPDVLFNGGDLMIIVIGVLIFASCVSIVNSFNTNLKERKKQIGLLRAVGTTQRQIINMFGREAFIISLIATPVGVAASYGIVRIALTLFGGDCVMTKSIWALVIAAIVNIAVVMLAALIPLKSASKITPMQAIRNIESARQVKRKKIVSKKEYKPSKLIARRSLAFSRGSRIAVCVLLSVTIVISCLGLSYVAYIKNDIRELGADYTLGGMGYYTGEGYINTDSVLNSLSESDRANIASLPEVSTTSGKKDLSACIEIDKYNDYYNLLMANNFTWSRNYDKLSKEELKKQWLDNMEDSEEKEYYHSVKQVLQSEKELFASPIQSNTEEQIKKLQGRILDGKIDLNKLSSGEEVILVAPKEVRYYLSKRNGGVYVERKYDGKTNKTMEEIASATGDFKAGDMLEVVIGVADYEYDEAAAKEKFTLLDKKTKEVKIGAIVSPNDAEDFSYEFGMITTLEGIDAFYKNVSYAGLDINVEGDIDDEINQHMMETLQYYADKYGGYVQSNYEYVDFQVEQYHTVMTALAVIIVLGFVICASIINNSISARIRENKSVIGTLRAVGADTSALVKVYINEMLSMFSLGTIIGYCIFAAIWIVLIIAEKYFGANIEFVLQPWTSIAMTAVLFATCSINLWLKVKNEMKNSIVENIREL